MLAHTQIYLSTHLLAFMSGAAAGLGAIYAIARYYRG